MFSTKALDVSAARVRSLVHSFVATCESSAGRSTYSAGSAAPTAYPTDRRDIHLANAKFLQEAGFAGPHELSLLLKWALARIARVKNGFEIRGFLDLDDYSTWRIQEEGGLLVFLFLFDLGGFF